GNKLMRFFFLALALVVGCTSQGSHNDLRGVSTIGQCAQRTNSNPSDAMTSADCIVFEDSTLNAINETLPAPTPGRWLRIKDLAGQAGTNLITILHHASETIDGQTSITIPINYGMVELITTGTNWSVVNPPHMGSQVTSYCTTNTVVQVNGAYVPAAGTLTTGSVLEAIGTSNLGYSPALFYSQDWPALRGLVEWNEPLSNETTHTTTTSGAIYVSRFT